ncbi:hypothetical protein RB195_023266 [Necator americanus]|uniref:Reverse transcriptase domain-containing protein n=1 Tax=Necator americanus TaxID=51031 RepID=A0ABR1EIJ3_NECAM
MIDQVFVVEVWQRYSKPLQLAHLDFEAVFDSPHRGLLLSALRADEVPGKFAILISDMNGRTTLAVRTPAGCATPFKVETAVRQGLWRNTFCSTLPSMISCEEHLSNVPLMCKDALKLTRHSLTKCLWATPIANEVKLRVYLSTIRPMMMYRAETWTAPSTVMERLECTERKLFRRLLGYFWPRVCHNDYLYAEIDVVYRRMTRGRYQHLAPPSKVAKVNRLRFFGHILRRPADRLVQRVLRNLPGSSWKTPPGRKRKFWTEVVKEDMRTLGVDRQYRRDVRFRRIWHSDEWIDCVQALAEGCTELCSRTAHGPSTVMENLDCMERKLTRSSVEM